MSKHILLVHDLAGYGKVSLSAMMPVLSHMGHHLYTCLLYTSPSPRD